jgi:RNA polymerase sigma-70 factor (ECF subfamily)
VGFEVTTVDLNPPRETASPDEASAALQAMSRADLVRLEHFARIRTSGLVELDWEDLLHEAIDRVLSGSRRWPKEVPFVVFMCGTMRSIASEVWRSRSARQEIALVDLVPTHERDAAHEMELIDELPDPERKASAREMLAKIEALFRNDSHAMAILRGLTESLSPKEIQQNAAISPRTYASAQKRIRRTLMRAVKEGRL